MGTDMWGLVSLGEALGPSLRKMRGDQASGSPGL